MNVPLHREAVRVHRTEYCETAEFDQNRQYSEPHPSKAVLVSKEDRTDGAHHGRCACDQQNKSQHVELPT